MTPKAITDLLTPVAGLASAAVGLVTAIVAITKYFNYRSKQDEMRLVKQSFDGVVTSLQSDSLIERMSGAILLRRFYDSHTEMGTGGAPYWKVAVDVTAAILRGQTTSDFQKLLADGLAFAPRLVRADLQRTNLQFAYLGSRKTGESEAEEIRTDLRFADFYRADLSKASLKRANAGRAVFYQARLHNTVFSGADLTGANFFDADIKGAVFRGAILYGANFSGARNLPVELRAALDEKGIYQDQKPFQPPPNSNQNAQITVFVSKPGYLSAPQKQMLESLKQRLKAEDIVAQTLEREDYPGFGAVGEIRRVISGCAGAIIFGFSELKVLNGTWRANTPEEKAIGGLCLPTSWAQIEAGMAIMDGIPLLIMHQIGVEGGIFDVAENANGVYRICMDEDWDSARSSNAFSNWSTDVREQAGSISARKG